MSEPTPREPGVAKSGHSFAWSCAFFGVLITGLALASGGWAGMIQTEYRPLPRFQQGIMLALGWACYGIVPGLIVGLLLDWRVRRPTRNRRDLP